MNNKEYRELLNRLDKLERPNGYEPTIPMRWGSCKWCGGDVVQKAERKYIGSFGPYVVNVLRCKSCEAEASPMLEMSDRRKTKRDK